MFMQEIKGLVRKKPKIFAARTRSLAGSTSMEVMEAEWCGDEESRRVGNFRASFRGLEHG